MMQVLTLYIHTQEGIYEQYSKAKAFRQDRNH